MTSESDIRKGLAGVVADTTAISKVNPETNSLLYCGYPVQELAAQCSMEEVAYLLWNGELPDSAQLAQLEQQERQQRDLDSEIRQVIDLHPTSAHPMHVLRSAVSVLAGLDSTADDLSEGATAAQSVRLFAKLPAIVAYDQRRRRGQEPVPADDSLDFSENFLKMTFGEVPEPVVVDAFRVSLVLYAEHSFNASTFTARVIASTLSDVYSAVTGAVGALKGPLHGGANEEVMHTFDEIGSADQVEPWLQKALTEKRKIMGFGHRVYKSGDSRVPTMKTALDGLVAHYDRPDLGELYRGLEEGMRREKSIEPNLDYPSGPAYHLMGFDTAAFTPIFVAARVTGWTAHIREQLGANALIRPLSAYSGPDERHLTA